tara:strand:+ start:119 stop:244 length:126 start_codon:yes stop_codon:yes gene_type:complete
MGACLSKKQERPDDRYIIKASLGAHDHNYRRKNTIAPIAIQ